MQSSNCYLFLKRPLSIFNRPMANFVHSLNQSIGAMKPACHTQAPLKAVIWSQMFYNVSCVVVDGWFMLIPTKKHEMVHLRAVMHHMTKTQMSTFWECARLHVCALVCTFVRSFARLCARLHVCALVVRHFLWRPKSTKARKLLQITSQVFRDHMFAIFSACGTNPHIWPHILPVWVHGPRSATPWAHRSSSCPQAPAVEVHSWALPVDSKVLSLKDKHSYIGYISYIDLSYCCIL